MIQIEKEMAVDPAAGPDKSVAIGPKTRKPDGSSQVPIETITAEDVQAALRRTCEKTSHTRKPALVCVVCGHIVFTETVKRGPSRKERRRKHV